MQISTLLYKVVIIFEINDINDRIYIKKTHIPIKQKIKNLKVINGFVFPLITNE